MPQGTTDKVKLRIPKIIAGLQEKKPTSQIAKELGVTPRQIVNNMNHPLFIEMRDESIQKDLAQLYHKLEEFYDSEDPLDRRTALQVHAGMIKALIPKRVESRNENLNVDLKLEGRMAFREVLSKLPLDMQDRLIEKLGEVDTESGESPPTPIPASDPIKFMEAESSIIEEDDEEEEEEEELEIS